MGRRRRRGMPAQRVCRHYVRMSFHFYLYRAPEGLGPMQEWDEMRAETLGRADALKDGISALYPQIQWKRVNDTWIGMGPNGDGDAYLDLTLTEQEPGDC